MMLKPRVMDTRQKDEISEALAYDVKNDAGQEYRVVPAYLYNWYPPGLKERTVGPNSRLLIPMTRYYPTMDPPVVVDFEPAPPDPWYLEEKRRFCLEKKIVYVAIGIHEKMNEDGFKERVKAAQDAMEEGHTEIREDRALASITVEDWLQSPELTATLNAESLRRLADEQKVSGKFYRGVSKEHVLRRIKQQLVDELRSGLKNGSIVDPLERYRQPAATAE